MIKQYEYIQLVQIAQEFEKFPIELLYVFHELAKYHNKYQDEMEDYLGYPNKKINGGFGKAKGHAEDIVSLCKTHNIKWEFEKIDQDNWVEFRTKFKGSKQFVKYYYGDFDITKFIVFIKPFKEDELVEDNSEISVTDLDFGVDN